MYRRPTQPRHSESHSDDDDDDDDDGFINVSVQSETIETKSEIEYAEYVSKQLTGILSGACNESPLDVRDIVVVPSSQVTTTGKRAYIVTTFPGRDRVFFSSAALAYIHANVSPAATFEIQNNVLSIYIPVRAHDKRMLIRRAMFALTTAAVFALALWNK